jgi:mannose-1-phosphate guanylyltransferase
MAGGRGTRFWPRSRKRRAKQVLPIIGERSLLQQTYDRLRPLAPPNRFLVITNIYLRDEILRQIPEIPPQQIIAEPAQRNTAPCIGLAARILLDRDPEAVMGVFPADHVIARAARFRRLLVRAYRAARAGHLVVLGIEPLWPETGYGYLEFAAGRAPAGAVPVRRFQEKPGLPKAKRFLRRGFYWNSGMFLWTAATIYQALRRRLPDATQALDGVRGRPGEPEFDQTLAAHYPSCPDISIDYAILQRSRNTVGFPCRNLGWNDVGSWKAVYELLPKDRHANVARSQTLLHKSQGNYVDAPDRLVALVGVENLIVVESDGVLLIAARDRAQEVGDLVKRLETEGREGLL